MRSRPRPPGWLDWSCRSAFTPGYFNPGRSSATCVTIWSRHAEPPDAGRPRGAWSPCVGSTGGRAALRQVRLRAGAGDSGGAVGVLVALPGDVGDGAPGLGPGGLDRLGGGLPGALLAEVDGLVHLAGEPLDARVAGE